MKARRPLEDHERLVTVFYLMDRGHFPPWGEDQVEFISRLFDWDEERTRESFARCVAEGWLNTEPPEDFISSEARFFPLA